MLRDNLARLSREERPRALISNLRRVGYQVKEKNGLYSLSSERGSCPPQVHWRKLANTIIQLDEEGLPQIVAYGVPELFPPIAGELDAILDNAAVGNYRVEPILFGSVCWLYFHDGRWKLATKRCADVRSMTLRSDGPTFLSAFEEALAGALPSDADKVGEMGEPSVETLSRRLNRQYTYGFVLHHRGIHMFTYAGFATKLWHVSTIDTLTGEAIKGETVGIPEPPLLYHASLQFGETGALDHASVVSTLDEDKWSPALVEEGGIKVLQSGEIFDRGVRHSMPMCQLKESPIVKVLRARIAEMCDGSTESLHRLDDNLGFVLRSVEPAATFPNDHVVIKSPLYVFIEKHIGKILPIRIVVGRLLYAYPEEQTKFCQVFPHLVGLIKLARTEVNSMARLILNYHQGLGAVARRLWRRGQASEKDATDDCHAVIGWGGASLGDTAVPSHIASSLITELHDIVMQAIGYRNFTSTAVFNELLNPRGRARDRVIDGLMSLLPAEEFSLDQLRPNIASRILNNIPGAAPIMTPEDFPPL